MRKYLRTSPTWAALPLRIALGSVMFVHGAQKVMGVWGGRGFSAWIADSAPLGFMRPSWLWLAAAAFAEFFGGMLVIIGLLTRPAAFFIACTMLTAVVGVHWPNGFLQSRGGFEFPGALLGMAISLLILGGGKASLDHKIG